MQAEIEKKPQKPALRQRLLRIVRSPALLVVIILAGYGVLALSYVRADRNAVDLEFRADTSRAALRRPAPDTATVEAKLAESEARLASLKSNRVTTIPEEDLVQQTLQAASETGVVVTSAGTRADTFVTKGGERVRATPFFVRATGTIEQLEAFLGAMERGRVETLELQSALITEESGTRALTLAAVIYSHLPLEPEGAQGQSAGTPTAVSKAQKGN